MSYETIDPIINAWAAKYLLHFYTEDRGYEIRSIRYVYSDGRKWQIWIDVPDQKGNVQVHVSDLKKRREDYKTTVADLSQCLEQAYATAMKWMG